MIIRTIFLYIQLLGRVFLNLIDDVLDFLYFSIVAIKGIFSPSYYNNGLIDQLMSIGFYSLPVIGMTAIFSGSVLALQTYEGFSRFSAEQSIPMVVVISLTRELGPVLSSLMVAGRVGSAVAAEIGSMKITEQIDALYTLSTEPIKYLTTPRLIAALLTMPFLVLVFDVIGVLGGYLVSVLKLGFNSTKYIDNTFQYLEVMDVVSGVFKAVVFGVVIILMSCFCGFKSGKGARGVGRATTVALVNSSVLILFSNFALTQLFFQK